MRRILSGRLATSLALLVVLAGCNRHSSHKDENSHSALPDAAGASGPDLNAPAGTVVQPALTEWRPSPFVRPQLPVSKLPSSEPPAGKHPSKAVRATRSFQMPALLAANTRSETAGPVLPSPPVLAPPTPEAGQYPALPDGTCCAATATYEPARRNGFQRLIHDVPGLRRLDPSSAGGKGFVPARPLRDIQISLPPNSSPALMGKMQMDLKATVDPSGRVTRVELLWPKDEDLATLAAYGASEWEFAPAKLNDRPVASELILHFRFDHGSLAQAVADKSGSH